jgi:hypothetical protein
VEIDLKELTPLVARAHEIDPTKRYVVVVDQNALSHAAMQRLGEVWNKAFGVAPLIIRTIEDGVRIFEIEGKETSDAR